MFFSAFGVPVVHAEGENEKTTEEASPEEGKENENRVVIEVSTQEELMEVADFCHDDIWSLNKTILLTNDISIVGHFDSIPYFNGIFDGNGHTVKNYRYSGDNYINGFINEIGSEGLVKNLTLDAGIHSGEEAQCIGALAGINAGAKLVMTAHISLPNVTGSNTPSTLSSLVLQDKLRGELGFDGVMHLQDAFEAMKSSGRCFPTGLKGCGGGLCDTPTGRELLARFSKA